MAPLGDWALRLIARHFADSLHSMPGPRRRSQAPRSVRLVCAYVGPMRKLRTASRVAAAILALGGVALVSSPLSEWLGAARPGRLSWEKARRLFPPGQPGGRILTGSLRNDSPRPVEVRADEIMLVDGDGGEVPAEVELLGPRRRGGDSPMRGWRRKPHRVSRPSAALVEPRGSVGLRVAWRRPRQLADAPVWLHYGAGAVTLP